MGQLGPWWTSSGPRITAVRTTVTAPEGVNLVVVRLLTDRAGLSGLGCATFAYRAEAVAEPELPRAPAWTEVEQATARNGNHVEGFGLVVLPFLLVDGLTVDGPFDGHRERRRSERR